ncbi:hypothetical protein LINPERHAP2_LOCUS39262 [Linum perenne]
MTCALYLELSWPRVLMLSSPKMQRAKSTWVLEIHITWTMKLSKSPSNLDHNAVMCDLINKGVDIHATSLKEVEAEISSKRTAVVGQKVGLLLGLRGLGRCSWMTKEQGLHSRWKQLTKTLPGLPQTIVSRGIWLLKGKTCTNSSATSPT